MVSKLYFEETFSLATAQALQAWANNNLIVQGLGDYAMSIEYLGVGEMFAETEIVGLTIGDEYTLSTETINVVSNQYRTKINALPNDNTSMVAELGYGTGKRTLLFTATATTMYIAIGDVGGSLASSITVDNISLKIDGVEAVPNGTFEGNNTTGWYAQNSNATLSVYTYAGEPPVDIDNPYVKAMDIPPYDAGNATHFLIDTVAKFNTINLNSTAYQHFYIVPDDYSSQGRISLDTSGTDATPRTLSLYDGLDIHPASLLDTEQANIALIFNSDYWHVSRVSSIGQIWSDLIDGGSFLFQRNSSYNVLDRPHTKDGWYSVRFKSLSTHNTVQMPYFDAPTQSMYNADVAQVMFQDFKADSQIHNNVVVLGEGRNFKFSKLHDEQISKNVTFDGTVIDSCINWSDGDVYCDSDGTPNPNGDYSLAEAGFGGIKSGTGDNTTRVTLSNNIYWGGKPTWPGSVDLSSPAPGMFLAYYGTRNLSMIGNMAIGTPNGFTIADKENEERGTWNADIRENISYQTGNTAQSATNQSAGMRLSNAEDMNATDNLLKEVRGTAAFVEYNFFGNYFGENNFVNCAGDGSWGMVKYEGNQSDVEGLQPVDTNNYLTDVQGDAIYTDDYVFDYMKYTTTVQEMTIPKVLKPTQTRPLNKG